MKHCHLNLCCNELPFLKQKLPFLYEHFGQIIIIDYDILKECNSIDGSIEFIKTYPDPENKITLLTNFNPNEITEYNGVSMIAKQKMFAYGSKYINNDIDIIWATDLDEFFDKNAINIVNDKFQNDKNLISIDIPHINFVYNQYNTFKYKTLFYIKPRITKHIKGKIYGHCNFETYGKTLKLTNCRFYHFSYVGYNRCNHKLLLFNTKTTSKHQYIDWCKKYKNHLINKKKHIDICHPGSKNIISIKYDKTYPSYINIEQMINELNEL
jgi:hypothetical protein